MGPPLALTAAHLRGLLSIRVITSLCVMPFHALGTAVLNSSLHFGFWSETPSFIRTHRFSTGLRSGDWAGQFITVICSWSKHSCTSREVWHVASCWKVQPWGIPSKCIVGIDAFYRVLIYPSPFNLPSTLDSIPVPLALMHPHTMMPPPPCCTFARMQLSLSSSLAIRLTYTLPSLLCRRNFDSSLKITFHHCLAGHPMCVFANCRRAFLRWDINFGFLLGLRPNSPASRSLFWVVDLDILTPCCSGISAFICGAVHLTFADYGTVLSQLSSAYVRVSWCP